MNDQKEYTEEGLAEMAFNHPVVSKNKVPDSTLEEKFYYAIENATAGLFEENIPYKEARKSAAKACVDIAKEYTAQFQSPEISDEERVDLSEQYDAALNEIGQLQEQLKEAEEEIRDLNRREY